MSQAGVHISVLYQPVIDALQPHADGRYIDGTLGAGGHAAGILQASAPTGRLLGLDADTKALAVAAQNLARYGERALLIHSNFENLKSIAAANGFDPADGIVLDLGLSSMQLADAERGFSFLSDGALDMRFNADNETTAAELVNALDEKGLADLIFEYGEEHASRRIARAIVNARPIETATQLANVIERAVGRHGKIHPATKTFQALRIAVNRELEVIENVLPQIVDTLAPGGRVAIISFHSLEDRRIKNFFKSSERLRVLTKHPIRPTREESIANSRSRSAKLRVAEKIL
ncbi:MAG: 16S rRNA (cytosine(1402)-N(4))-methyltransferase RsmH [Chloroflexi bacterium]|nr:16S rRNA (cytosine(1402)-N(4))-methyltransferase RsmH [Chloroflexota bacterium]